MVDRNTGTITKTGTTNTGDLMFPQSVALDPLGKFLAVNQFRKNPGSSDFVGATITIFNIDQANGAATQVPAAPFNYEFGRAVTFDRSGNYIYIGGFANSVAVVHALRIDRNNGSLTPVSGSPFALPVPVATLAVDASGKYLYGGSDNTIVAYRIDPVTGALTLLPFTASASADADLISVSQ